MSTLTHIRVAEQLRNAFISELEGVATSHWSRLLETCRNFQSFGANLREATEHIKFCEPKRVFDLFSTPLVYTESLDESSYFVICPKSTSTLALVLCKQNDKWYGRFFVVAPADDFLNDPTGHEGGFTLAELAMDFDGQITKFLCPEFDDVVNISEWLECFKEEFADDDSDELKRTIVQTELQDYCRGIREASAKARLLEFALWLVDGVDEIHLRDWSGVYDPADEMANEPESPTTTRHESIDSQLVEPSIKRRRVR